MKGIMFRPEVWQAKLVVLERTGEAQTRRLVHVPEEWVIERVTHAGQLELSRNHGSDHKYLHGPYLSGETMYVKEAWATEKRYDALPPRAIPTTAHIHFMADGVGEWPLYLEVGKLRSLMFLRESMARYFLTIKDVRPDRLQGISQDDALAEGVSRNMASQLGLSVPVSEEEFNLTAARRTYEALWDSINAKKGHPWAKNDWVWAYTFALVPRPEGATR